VAPAPFSGAPVDTRHIPPGLTLFGRQQLA
jgi:hypothetical protein